MLTSGQPAELAELLAVEFPLYLLVDNRRAGIEQRDLARFFASRAGQALSRDLIMSSVWGYDAMVTHQQAVAAIESCKLANAELLHRRSIPRQPLLGE